MNLVRHLASAVLFVALVSACGGAAGTPIPSRACTSTGSGTLCNGQLIRPPDATPLANPPAGPAGTGVTVTLQTDKGAIVIEVYDSSAPVAATNFLNLAREGFYDGTTFHRLVPGFVIQGGDPNGNSTGGPGYTIQDEPVVGRYARGIVAMARSPGPDSQGSQFFIVLDDSAGQSLAGGGYAIIGMVAQGMDVVDAIAAMPNAGSAQGNLALDPVVMQHVTVQQP
jgi:peptidyl-prolyl cis-trans isomerase B (cyclophilin B)